MTQRSTAMAKATRPRVGFVGVGWIGRHRMEAMARTGRVDVVAVADPVGELTDQARQVAPAARAHADLESLLAAEDVDAVVIATPSALHAAQSIAALEAGKAVFCQKPLGRSAAEVRAVLDAAGRADRLLGVDLSYRHVVGMRKAREIIAGGAIGEVYAVDLVFHNAYGPDKPWFYDPARSGGGCVIDLGIHLVDLALWVLDFPRIEGVTSRLFVGGKPLGGRTDVVEDYATARLDLSTGTAVDLACSWRLPAGCDAVIEASFYGTGGGVSMRNVNGSFYDFLTERFDGTQRQTLAEPPDEWGARSAETWARQLAESPRFDPAAEHLLASAEAIDRIYGR